MHVVYCICISNTIYGDSFTYTCTEHRVSQLAILHWANCIRAFRHCRKLRAEVETYLDTQNRFERLKRSDKDRAKNMQSFLNQEIHGRHRKLQKLSLDDHELLDHLKKVRSPPTLLQPACRTQTFRALSVMVGRTIGLSREHRLFHPNSPSRMQNDGIPMSYHWAGSIGSSDITCTCSESINNIV